MQAEQALRFGPYRFDPQTGQLWRGTQEVKLTPKALAVLRLLVTQPGQVVTKDELFQTVWPDVVVGDDALTSCIQELRQALRDDARNSRYIETVHRRGFQFIGTVASSQQEEANQKAKVAPPSPVPSTQHPAPTLVGRDTELAQLHHWLEKALHGERQIAFVSGEPGIGKTTLIEAFLAGIRRQESGNSSPAPTNPRSLTPVPWISRGQCIEHYGAGEAYLPVLEALGRLCREPGGKQLIALLNQHAPTWLVQMPGLLSATELEALQRKTQGATRERMLRELAEALEVITNERPLLLWLEDLHWSDVSTLDFLSMLARRREPCQLLVIGTYRPVDVMVHEHPLKAVKQELRLHGQCQELALDFLSEAAVAEYLAGRFGSPSPAPAGEGRGEGRFRSPLQLARTVHRRTDGNPLFMVNVVNDLVARGVLVQSDGQWELQGRVEEVAGGVPESLQQLIAQQLERLRPETQRLLGVASVAGAEFSAAAVAAGVETEMEGIEEQCEALVRREHFLRASGTAEWPDGTVAARYGFRHALYQDVLYHRLTVRRRQRLHQQIGEWVEQGYGNQAREIAAELALHFERGRDYRRAIQYLQQAGENAVRRSAHQEAISLLTKGLELLKTLPDTPARTQQELTLQVALGSALVAIKGYTSPEVERAWTRARELCQQVGEPPQLFWVLVGLWNFSFVQAQFQTTRERAEQLLTLAQSGQDQALLLQAHHSLGTTLFMLGEFIPAHEHLEQSLALYYSQKHRFPAFVLSSETGVDCLSFAAWVLWFLGYPDQALKRSDEALALAQELVRPFPLAFALHGAAQLHLNRREAQAAQALTEEVMALATEQGFPFWLAVGTVHRGRALAEQGQVEEGMEQMRQGMATLQAIGTEAGRPGQLAQLAWAYGQMGQAEEGIALVNEALATVNKTGERVGEAGLYRLKGELTLQQWKVESQKSKVPNTQHPTPSTQGEAEACFLKAIDIARKQQAKSLELRAVMSLSRLWQQQGKHHAARNMLSEIYNWFTEGFDTKDLQEAKALIEELNH